MQIEVLQGDITQAQADVIVNAANETLLGGGGVDGAIHDAAGPGLYEECKQIGGCPTGEVRVTSAHALPFKAIIHAVGPVWQGGRKSEDALLRTCYVGALEAAAQLGADSVAFPAISTGAFAFPEDLAARIAVGTCRAWTEAAPHTAQLIAFDAQSAAVLRAALEAQS